MKQYYFKSGSEWRKWLSINHRQDESIELIFYKKGTGKPTMDYNTAVEEALCFGWIDSIKKRLDDERYTFRFSPRKDNSKWSESNKKRVAKLVKEKRITKYGLAKINAAKKNGMWDKPDRPEIPDELPKVFAKALRKNKKAESNFNSLAPSYRKQYIAWIATAKQESTVVKRLNEAIQLLEEGRKLGMR